MVPRSWRHMVGNWVCHVLETMGNWLSVLTAESSVGCVVSGLGPALWLWEHVPLVLGDGVRAL